MIAPSFQFSILITILACKTHNTSALKSLSNIGSDIIFESDSDIHHNHRQLLFDFFDDVLSSATETFDKVMNSVEEFTGVKIPIEGSHIKDTVKGVGDGIGEGLKGIGDTIGGGLKGIGVGMEQGVKEVTGGVIDTVDEVTNGYIGTGPFKIGMKLRERRTLKILQEINSSIEGGLSGWDENDDFCSWPGIKCNKQGNQVRSLDLSNLGLTGRVPEDVTRLLHLGSLDLSGNQFSGPLPSSLGRLKRLRFLDVSNNEFTGGIPDNFSKSLLTLDLSNNLFTGGIPDELGSLSNLRSLRLEGNPRLVGGMIDSLCLLHAAYLSTQSEDNSLLAGLFQTLLPTLGLPDISGLLDFVAPVEAALGFLSADCKIGESFCFCCSAGTNQCCYTNGRQTCGEELLNDFGINF